MEFQALIVVAIFILLFPLVRFLFRKIRGKGSHRWRRKSAKKTFHKLKNFPKNSQKIAYLKKIDPFVFEELILYSVSQREGVKVQVSDRYTGDGGVDGTFHARHNGKKVKVVIQAKRYSGYIKKSHVEEFCEVIDKERADLGLFIHTGKTGKAVHEVHCPKLRMYSGESLIDFLFK